VPIALAAAAIGLAVGLASGGSLKALADTPVRALWLLGAGLALQIAFGSFDPGWFDAQTRFWILIGSNLLVVGFLIANLRLPGMWLAAAGLALNLIVIASNGAMPVSAQATETFGGSPPAEGGGFKHEPMTDTTSFAILGDVIPIGPLRLVISLGDVLLAAGILYLVFARTRVGERGRHSHDRA
jgi:hypothetical protein